MTMHTLLAFAPALCAFTIIGAVVGYQYWLVLKPFRRPEDLS